LYILVDILLKDKALNHRLLWYFSQISCRMASNISSTLSTYENDTVGNWVFNDFASANSTSNLDLNAGNLPNFGRRPFPRSSRRG